MTDEETLQKIAAILGDWRPTPRMGVMAQRVDGGWLIGGFLGDDQYIKHTGMAPDGPDTPNDPIAAALWLDAHAKSRQRRSQVEAAHVEIVSVDPIAPAVAGNWDTDAGEREMGDGPAAADVPLGDAGSGAASDAAADGGDVGDELGESSLVRSAVEGEDFDMGVFSVEAPPTDAEFEEPVSADDLAGIEDALRGEPLLTGVENEEYEPVYAGPIDPHPGGVVYFGDDIKVIQLAKMGRLAQIARALKDVLQEGWSIEEFRSLQNLIVRMDRGEAPNDIDAKYRFETIGERSRAMSRIDAYKDARELELDTLDRAGIEAFDPEEGWPE